MKLSKSFSNITLVISAIALSACATGAKVNTELLSEVKKTAVVKVGFDRRVQGGASNSIDNQLKQIGKWVGKYPYHQKRTTVL